MNKKPNDPLTFEEICAMFPDAPEVECPYFERQNVKVDSTSSYLEDFVELKVAPPPKED